MVKKHMLKKVNASGFVIGISRSRFCALVLPYVAQTGFANISVEMLTIKPQVMQVVAVNTSNN
jgi:hypothetical protein